MKLISASAEPISDFATVEHHPAPVEHHEAIGDIENMVDIVANEQNRAPARLDLTDEVEHLRQSR